MNTRIVLLGFVLIGMVACKPSASSPDAEGKTITVADSRILEKVDLYELVDSVSYVPLETSDRILLGDVLCAKRAGDYYFVQDTKGLFAFDAHGRFVSEIGHRGQGPEEYYNLDCFYLDSGRQLACIVSNVQKKIFRYTFDGKFHSTLSLEDDDANIVFAMTCDEGEHLLAHYPLPNDAKAADREYAMLSCQGDKLTAAKLLDAPKVHSGITIYQLLYEPMASFRNRPLFISAFSNRVYTLKEGRAAVEYVIDLPGIVADDDFWEKHANMELLQLREAMRQQHVGMGITAIEANDDYLFLVINYGKTLVWDGTTGWLIKNVYDSNSGLLSILFDGVSDSRLGVLSAEFLYQNKEHIKAGNHPQLASVAERIGEEDNPVLYRYYFKKSLDKLSGSTQVGY